MGIEKSLPDKVIQPTSEGIDRGLGEANSTYVQFAETIKKNMQAYSDIINQPRPISERYSHMSTSDRASQFSPFAALVGHEDAIEETGRLTDERIELDEYEIARLDEKLRFINENIGSGINIRITYFKPDEKKSGGEYLFISGSVKKIDEYEHTVVMTDKRVIPVEQIIGIELEI